MNINAYRNHPNGMTNDQLRAVAPSIFASEPWHKMSDKYAFIPTIQVVDKMRAEGFVPVHAVQSRTRIEGKGDFTRHQIRFRSLSQNQEMTRHLGQLYPELMLTNAHDGGSTYNLDAALWRLICLNGCVVSDSTVNQIKVPHRGNADGVIEASFEVIDQMPKVLESVEQFQRLRLNAPQAQAFATAALTLRYDEGEAPIQAAQVISARRVEDRDPTLWNVYNRAQENLINGGVRGRNPETQRRARTRAVSGISENTKLNKALWTLTSEMAKLIS